MLLRYIRALRQAHRSLNMGDVPRWQREIVEKVRGYTMAGELRTLSTIAVTEYIENHGISGSIVECGVWRGGQMMAVALTLQHLGAERDIYLFDTFAGMTEPDERDRDHHGALAAPVYDASLKRPVGERWCEAMIEDVRKNLDSTGYRSSRVHLVKGDVEVVIPSAAPEVIAYLRLDTDWYASTAHEFHHLYPRVSRLGVITVDDYGHWQGARRATDEYLEANGIAAMLNRIDYSARQFVKV